MSSSLSMRGQLDLTQPIAYFLVGRSTTGGNTYYTYQDAPSAADSSTHAVFASDKYDLDSTWNPRIVFINTTSTPGEYTLSAPLTAGGTPAPLYVSTYAGSSNVLEIVDAGQTPAVVKLQPSVNVGTAALWSGVWYTITDVNGNPLVWKDLATLNSTGNFKGSSGNADPATLTDASFQIMFVPRDAGSNGSIAVWNGKCQIPSGNNVSLVLWGMWVDGDPGAPSGCDGPGWSTGTANPIQGATGCVFTSTEVCEEGYLYTICNNGTGCGECLGACPPTTTGPVVCSFDHDPALQSAGVSPLSCAPKDPKPLTFWQRYRTVIIIAICVFLLLIVLGLIFVLWAFRKRPAPAAPNRSY